MDLFDDLPDPSNNASTNSTSACSQKEQIICKNHSNGDISKKRKMDDSESSEMPNTVRQKPTVKYKLFGYHAERQGEREEMQDCYVLLENFTDKVQGLHPSVYRLALFAVYDGHGGRRASQHAADNLHVNLINKFPKGDVSQVEKDLKKVLIEAFRKTDEDFLKEAAKSKPAWKDGTTATVILFVNETAFIASLGDSQAFLCRSKEGQDNFTPVHLTSVHNPSMYEERMRIQKAGGHVRDGRVMGVLEVSRSIGDGQFKKHGVSCIPDVKKCQLTDFDRYIILACDGLWKTFDGQECIEFTNKSLLECKGTEEEKVNDKVCARLANEAVLRLSADNVTVVLISIEKT